MLSAAVAENIREHWHKSCERTLNQYSMFEISEAQLTALGIMLIITNIYLDFFFLFLMKCKILGYSEELKKWKWIGQIENRSER